MTDQFALNLAIYERGLMERTELLPEWCNWIFNGMPVWDPQRLLLTEPYLPLHPIGILHLAGQKGHWADVATPTGGKIRIPVQFPDFLQFLEEERLRDRKSSV